MFKIKEGTVRNLNKKLVTGALITTLVMGGLTGCSTIGFSYKENSKEQIVVTGTQDYAIVSKYLVAEIEMNGEKDLYILDPYYDVEKENVLDCKDVFTGKNLISIDLENNKSLDYKKIISIEELGDYLINIDYVKKEYNIKDIKNILENIKEDYYIDSFGLIKK